MKLYEVNRAIEELIAMLEPDPETGEVTAADEVMERLHALEMERSRILEYLAKLVLNCRAEAASVRAEEKRLAERRHGLENREDRLMQILDRECDGQKTDCGVATVNYRATSRVEITDEAQAVGWLVTQAYVTRQVAPLLKEWSDIHIFSKAIADIGNPQFIRFLIKEDCTSMAMEAYHKKDFRSHRVPERTDERWEMEVRSMPLCMLLKNRLGWDGTKSYRVQGRTYPAQKVVVFDLTAAEPIQK